MTLFISKSLARFHCQNYQNRHRSLSVTVGTVVVNCSI
jgi:hypothetical protein